MDSNEVEINEKIDETNSNKSEVSENVTENITQPPCETVNEPHNEHKTEIGNSNEVPNNDNNESDVVLEPEQPSLDSAEKEVIIEPHETVNQSVDDIPENMNADDVQASSAAMSEDTGEVKEVIDIDEILSSIHEGSALQSVDENQSPKTDDQKKEEKKAEDQVLSEDVVLLSDGESENKESKEEIGSVELLDKSNEVIEHTDMQIIDKLNLDENEPETSETVALQAENVDDIQISSAKLPATKSDTNKDISDAGECLETVSNAIESVTIPEQNEEIGNDEQQHEDTTSESCNIMDLLLENQDLFGQVEDDASEAQKDSEIPSNDPDATIKLIDEKKDEEMKEFNVEIENNNENTDITVDAEPIQPEEELPELEDKPTVRRECLNVDCSKECSTFFEAPEFVISYFHLSKRPKILYVCEQCYDSVTESYGELCAALEDKQPLFSTAAKYNDLVEVIDSSDEEDDTDSKMGENSEKNEFDAETLTLIETELEAVIEETLKKVDIGQQMDWNRQILKAKIDNNEKNCAEMMNEMKTLQNRIDKLYSSTYNFRHNFIEEVQSLDLTTLKPTQICNETYPPAGELKYHDIQFNTLYYTFRNRLISSWQPCKVVDKVEVDDGETEYMVRFCKKKNTNLKKVPSKHLAYGRTSDVRLNIGTRVIALFDDSDAGGKTAPKNSPLKNNFYPGVIAEPLSLYTRWRYLVFFDDGWVQYVYHENIRVVCGATENVWELIEEPGAKTFIEGYVKECKNKRPIVQVRSGQRIQTEHGGKWYNGIVNNVDGSLVQIYFEDLKRYEWIYRGSTRLFPLYKKLKVKATSTNRNEASIEYIVIDDDKEPERSTEPPVEETPPTAVTTPAKSNPIQRTFASQAARDTPQQKQREQKRSVAKKSTAPQPKPAIQHMNNSTIYVDEDKPKGKVVYYTAKKHIDVKKYIHHECAPSCLISVSHNLSTYSPLSKALLSGFERQICKTRFNKKFVVYRAPCGRRLRDMYEMHKYLRITNSKLNVDNFTFDPLIHCLAEYVIDSYVMKKADLSGGIEKMPVQLINCYDNSMPPSCKYSAKRIPTEGVDLNLDPDFLCGCDCTDDCLDKSKCACWQLTLQGAKYGNPDTPIQDIGYEYKRLNEPVPSGIYECNAQCKCKSSCVNRVVQHPLQLKLQVFKTVNRGWGLRCLNDVPKGSFICCYAGNLLTETAANEAGEDLGDEYFAELDYIEVVENMKEGYEPEVVNEDPDSSETDEDFDVENEIRSRNDDSDDEFVAKRYSTSEDSESRRYRTRNSVDTRKNPIQKPPAAVPSTDKIKERNSSSDEEGDSIRQVKNFMASNTMPLNDDPDDERGKSIRKFFGKNEAVYIMDAKKAGNIGRYFNHSCGPNLFVQNVFVDTHDLRFPWVAFFASTHIRAGTELTWNYNYEVGSVPGKVLICQCGDEKCRGRIL